MCMVTCLNVHDENAGTVNAFLCIQEAQLPQRDRATLHVIEYFAK